MLVVRMGCEWAVGRDPTVVEKSVAVWVAFAAYRTVALMEVYRLVA